MSTPPPGWYPDPQSVGTLRFWDGQSWTGSRAPVAQPAVVVLPPAGPNHLIHLILTLVTCGLWAPVWLLVAILDSRPDGPAAPLSRTARILGFVALGLLVALVVASNVSRYT